MSETHHPTQSLAQVDAELLRTRAELMRGVRLLDAVLEAYADVTEAGSWSGGANGSVSPGRGARQANVGENVTMSADPTGTLAAVSTAHAYMRRQAGLTAKKGPELRKAMKPVIHIIDDLEKTLKRTIPVALDPVTRERMQIADEADREYRQRHHKG